MRKWVGTAGVAVCLGLGCAGAPEDAFVGEYAGSLYCSGTGPDGFIETGPQAQELTIGKTVEGDLYIGGSCTWFLRALDSERATAQRGTCNTTFLGDPVVVTLDNGVVELDEPDIEYALNLAIDGVDFAYRLTCEFGGTRVE